MRLKINKACDLSSISAFPPHTRRLSGIPSGPQQSQFRSQPSQQSISQGLSSQHGMLSQLSQNSLEEVLPNDQRLGSQERENSIIKSSCFPSVPYKREESQMLTSRPSANLISKRSFASNHKCQINEELERRIGMMETSLSRIAMILESLQNDVIQVNKGTKEVLLEVDFIKQKMNAQENSVQSLNKEQEIVKDSISGGFKSMSEQLGKDTNQEKFQQILLVLSSLPPKIEAYMLSLQNELCNKFTNEIKTVTCKLKSIDQNCLIPSILTPKETIHCAGPPRNPGLLKTPYLQASDVSKEEIGGWSSVKKEKAISDRLAKTKKIKVNSSVEQEREYNIIIDPEEEIDQGFCCLLEEDRGINYRSTEDAKEETKRILQKARRRKRRCQNTIIIN